MRSDCLTLAEANKKTRKVHKEKIVILEYSPCRFKSKFLCNFCGNIWYSFPQNVWRGNGCPACAKIFKKDRFSISQVKEFLEKDGCKLISDEYKNSKTPLDVMFKCGHLGKISLESFKQGRRCLECGRKRVSLLNRIPKKDIMDRLLSFGIKHIIFPNGYENIRSMVEYTCENGHRNKKMVRNVLYDSVCRECYLMRMSVSQRGLLGNNWQGGKTKISDYFRRLNNDWKKKSMSACEYKCIITGDRFDDIHHLYPVSAMADDAFRILKIPRKETLSEYSSDEINSIIEKIEEIQDKYPLGVCLRKDVHKLFHKMYGSTKCTEGDFQEFYELAISGKIKFNLGDIK